MLGINELNLPLYRFRTVDNIDIEKMAQSIKMHGLLQPIIVRPTKEEDNFFEVVAGCTRFFGMQIFALEKSNVQCHPIK